MVSVSVSVVSSSGQVSGTVVSDPSILLEDGSHLLNEDGTKILTE